MLRRQKALAARADEAGAGYAHPSLENSRLMAEGTGRASIAQRWIITWPRLLRRARLMAARAARAMSGAALAIPDNRDKNSVSDMRIVFLVRWISFLPHYSTEWLIIDLACPLTG